MYRTISSMINPWTTSSNSSKLIIITIVDHMLLPVLLIPISPKTSSIILGCLLIDLLLTSTSNTNPNSNILQGMGTILKNDYLLPSTFLHQFKKIFISNPSRKLIRSMMHSGKKLLKIRNWCKFIRRAVGICCSWRTWPLTNSKLNKNRKKRSESILKFKWDRLKRRKDWKRNELSDKNNNSRGKISNIWKRKKDSWRNSKERKMKN